MLQIYTDKIIESSKDAQLFIKALKKECVKQDVECVEIESLNLCEPFIIPQPNGLTKEQLMYINKSINDVESVINVADIIVEAISTLSQYNSLTKCKKSNVAVFGGSGKVATGVINMLDNRFGGHDYTDIIDRHIDEVYLISSKTPLHEVAEYVKNSQIIVSALPFSNDLVVDVYGKQVIDVGSNLSHSKEKCELYIPYNLIGKHYVKELVEFADIMGGR